MRLYKRFAFLSVLATYFLIFVGGLVRVSGAGLGCPDWPKCFGRWIPPLSIQQLPAEFDPATFNFTLAWIEYVNRLIGVLIGLLILISAILALIYFRKKLSVLIPSLLAAILVAYQGWQGSQVVASELEPLIVSIHMGIAFVIISLLIYAAMSAHFALNPDLSVGVFPKNITGFVFGVWILSIVQVVLGTQVRGAIETAAKEYPLTFGTDLLEKVKIVDTLHMSTGIMVVFIILALVVVLLAKSRNLAYFIRQTLWALILVSLLQLVIGHFLILVGLPELIQLLHLWLASLLIGLLLILLVSIRNGGARL